MVTHIPYYYPGYATGIQVNNPGQGGPSGNPHGRDHLPQVWPAMTGGHVSGLVQFENQPRAHPQMSVANQYSYPSTYVLIPGIMKKPTYGA